MALVICESPLTGSLLVVAALVDWAFVQPSMRAKAALKIATAM